MRTDQQMEILIRAANPVPDLSVLESNAEPVPTEARPSHAPIAQPLVGSMGPPSTRLSSPRRSPRNLLKPAIGLAAALIAFVLVTEYVATETLPTSELVQARTDAVDTANTFVLALEAGDVSTALELVDPEAVIDWGPARQPEELQQALAWEQAFALSHTLRDCRAVSETTTERAIPVSCILIQTSEVAEDVDNVLEPAVARFTVEEGYITQATLDFTNLGEAAWNPFRRWVVAKHRDDISVMFSPGPRGWPAVTTEESLSLWESHTEAFLAYSHDVCGWPCTDTQPIPEEPTSP